MHTVPASVRILEISSYPPPRAGWGVRISFVREYLQSLGYECQVLNIGPSRRIPSPDYVDVQGGRDYCQKVFRHLTNGYLLHTHLNGDAPKGLALALIAEFMALFFGRRCVLTFHAGPVQRLFPKTKSRLFAPFYRLAFWLPRTIICNSEAVKNNILTYGVPESKVIPIPAFSKQYMAYSPVSLSRPLEKFLTEARPVIVTYFFYRPEFYVEPMMEGLKLLLRTMPELGVIMIGADTVSEEIAALIAEHGLKEHVYQAGDLAHDEFSTILSHAHFYLRTPQKDGVCSSVLEALSLRVPVIASENGTRPPSVITFKTGDPYDLADKIEKAWKDYESVRAKVIVPNVKDTVAEEAALLISHCA